MTQTLTAADLRVALDNLFSDPTRLDLFKLTVAYIVYGAELDELRALLPLIVKGNRPLAKDLGTADVHRRGNGSGRVHRPRSS